MMDKEVRSKTISEQMSGFGEHPQFSGLSQAQVAEMKELEQRTLDQFKLSVRKTD